MGRAHVHGIGDGLKRAGGLYCQHMQIVGENAGKVVGSYEAIDGSPFKD